MATFVDRTKNFAILLVSCAILIAMMSALKGGVFEPEIRIIAFVCQLVVVPILLAQASLDWLANRHMNLAKWRNGLGASSILVLAAMWFIFFGVILLSWLAPQLARHIPSIEWLGLSLLSSIVAFALAFALRSPARLYVMSSALLFFAGVQSTIYV